MIGRTTSLLTGIALLAALGLTPQKPYSQTPLTSPSIRAQDRNRLREENGFRVEHAVLWTPAQVNNYGFRMEVDDLDDPLAKEYNKFGNNSIISTSAAMSRMILRYLGDQHGISGLDTTVVRSRKKVEVLYTTLDNYIQLLPVENNPQSELYTLPVNTFERIPLDLRTPKRRTGYNMLPQIIEETDAPPRWIGVDDTVAMGTIPGKRAVYLFKGAAARGYDLTDPKNQTMVAGRLAYETVRGIGQIAGLEPAIESDGPNNFMNPLTLERLRQPTATKEQVKRIRAYFNEPSF